MAFDKKSQDPWDRKPKTRKAPPVSAPEDPEPPESKKGPLDSLRAWKERRRAEKDEARRLPPETCPWCGQEMEQGYLHAGGYNIYWSSGWMDTAAAFLGPLVVDHLRISNEGGLAHYKTTWLCRNCKKFVFTMPEDDPSIPETGEEQREEDS